jgi:hypothetical protein
MTQPVLPKPNGAELTKAVEVEAETLGVNPSELLLAFQAFMGRVLLSPDEIAEARIRGGQAIAERGRQDDYRAAEQRQREIRGHHDRLEGVAIAQRRIEECIAGAAHTLVAEATGATDTRDHLSLVPQAEEEPAA